MKFKINENIEEFYLSSLKNNSYLVYKSDNFKLSEIDILLLLKICLIEKRSKKIGKKILEVYKDSTKDREKLTIQRLESIGIKENMNNDKPIRIRQ